LYEIIEYRFADGESGTVIRALERRTRLILPLAVAVTALGPTAGAADELEPFASKKGGYELLIPEGWHRTEISQKGYYEAALSREKVETEEDVYTYGVSIVRFSDYRRVLPFEGNDPAKIAQQYADRLAGHYIGIGETTVMPLPAGEHGVETSGFEIVAFEDMPECLYFRLVIAVEGAEWFHAQWEIPCRERAARADELQRMVDSLAISPKWAGWAKKR
jgi:hypothetical protein